MAARENPFRVARPPGARTAPIPRPPRLSAEEARTLPAAAVQGPRAARSATNPFRVAPAAAAPAQSLPAAMGSAFVRGAADVPLATAQSVARATSTADLLPEFEAIDRGEQPPGLLDISRRPPIEKTLLRQYAQATPERRAEIRARAAQPVIESPVYQAAERGRAAVEEAFPVDPAQGERFLTKAAGGLGSTVGFAATGIAGRALGMPALPVTAATGAAANSQAQFQQAINSGASFEDATRASQISGLAGLSEALPISRFLDRFDKGTGGTIRKAIREGLKGGLEEAVQEIGQTIVDNATARGIYDPERGLIAGSGEAGAIGFSVGSLMSFLSSALGARMRGAPQSPAGAPGAPTAAPGTGVPPGAPAPAGAQPTPDLLGEIFGPEVGERAAPDLGVPDPLERFEMGGTASGRFLETQRARAQLEGSRQNIERTEREIAERQQRIDQIGGPVTGRFGPTQRAAVTMPPAPQRNPFRETSGTATGQFVEPQTAAVDLPPEPAPPKPDVPAFAGPIRPPAEVIRPPAVVPETSPRPPAAVTPQVAEVPGEGLASGWRDTLKAMPPGYTATRVPGKGPTVATVKAPNGDVIGEFDLEGPKIRGEFPSNFAVSEAHSHAAENDPEGYFKQPEHPGLVIREPRTGRTEVIQPPGTRPPAPAEAAAGPPIQTPPPPRVEGAQSAPQSGRGQGADWRAVMANRWPHQLSEDERGQLVEALGVASFDEATRELDRRGYAPEVSATPAPVRAPAPPRSAPRPAPAAKPARDKAIALQLRKQAETLAGQIEAKRNPAIAQQNPTARRARIAAGMAKEADMLADVQAKLGALAGQIEAGTVEPVLAGVRTRKVVETLRRAREYGHKFPSFHGDNLRDLIKAAEGKRGTAAAVKWARRFINDEYRTPLHTDSAAHIETLIKAAEKDRDAGWAIRQFRDELAEFKSLKASGIDASNWDEAKAAIGRLGEFRESPEQQRERERRELERQLIGLRIPGYFSTPEPLASRVIDEADIKPGMKVLEPSAGHGSLADIARDRGADVDVIEFNQTLRGILERKGYQPVASDFAEYQPGPVYDRIVMNPPFEDGQDAVHVRRAYNALKPGGRMVAIMGEGTFSRDDRTSREFRDWLDNVGGESERLPTGSFLKSLQSTGVKARLVTIDKPAAREARPAEQPTAPKPARKIQSLTAFLRSRGGIRETDAMRGELRARDITNKRRPGLISKKGMGLDDATLAAWEAGFLPGPERPPPDALLAALERDLRGTPVDGEPVEGDQTFSSLRQSPPDSADAVAEPKVAGQPPYDAAVRDPYDDTGGQVELHAGLPFGKVWDWWLGPFFQRWYEPFGRLPGREEYLRGRYKALGEADQIGQLTKHYYDRLARHPEHIREEIYQYLTTPGAAPATVADPTARQDAIDIKRTIDRIGRELVHYGVLEPGQYAKYRDRYLPRIYLKFLLDETAVSIGAGNRPKVPAAMMGSIKKRKNLSRFERDILLGEVKDPAYLAARAFGVAAHSIAILRFLDQVSQNPDWVYPQSMVSWRGRRYSARYLMAEAARLRETYKSWPAHLQQQVLNTGLQMEQAARAGIADPPDPKLYKQVPDTKRYGMLRGLWVKSEIYDDLVGSSLAEFSNETMSWLAQGWRTGINWWKMGKTSLNFPAGHVRNHISGAFQAQLFGGVGALNVPVEYLKTINDLAHNGPRYQAVIRHGGRSTSFAASELAKIHDAFRLKAQTRQYKYNPIRFLTEIGAQTVQWFGDKYSGNEVFWKALVMGYHMDRGMPEAEAAQIAHAAIFDYSLVPWWVRAIRQNVPLGAPFACVDEQTEALTKRGWLGLDEIVAGDIAASFDMATGRLCWKPVTGVFRAHYDGELIHFRDRHLDMMLTPDHRCVTYRRRRVPGMRSENAAEHALEIQRADALNTRDSIPVAATFDRAPEGEPLSNPMVEVLGWVVTEGWFHPYCQQVIICQNEGPKADAIRRALKASGVSWQNRNIGRMGVMASTDQIRFTIHAEDGRRIRELLPNKQLTPALLHRLSMSQLRLLVDTMIAGDGHTRPSGRRCFIQNASETLDAFCMALTMLGESYSVAKRSERGFCVLLRSGKRYTLKRTNAAPIAYDGRIWCPQVADTGIWLARRNGKPFVTGNTFMYKALPKSLETLFKRPLAYAPYVAGLAFLSALTSYYQDLDDDEEAGLTALMPPWLSPSMTVVLPMRDAYGRFMALDLSYFFPFGGWLKAAGYAKNGEIGKALDEIGMGNNPGFQIPKALLTNQDGLGRQVWDEGDPEHRQWLDFLWYTMGQALPPWAAPTGSIRQLHDAITGAPDRYGHPPRSPVAGAARFMGFTTQSMDVEVQFLRGTNARLAKIRDAEARQREIAREHGNKIAALSEQGKDTSSEERTMERELERQQAHLLKLHEELAAWQEKASPALELAR